MKFMLHTLVLWALCFLYSSRSELVASQNKLLFFTAKIENLPGTTGYLSYKQALEYLNRPENWRLKDQVLKTLLETELLAKLSPNIRRKANEFFNKLWIYDREILSNEQVEYLELSAKKNALPLNDMEQLFNGLMLSLNDVDGTSGVVISSEALKLDLQGNPFVSEERIKTFNAGLSLYYMKLLDYYKQLKEKPDSIHYIKQLVATVLLNVCTHRHRLPSMTLPYRSSRMQYCNLCQESYNIFSRGKYWQAFSYLTAVNVLSAAQIEQRKKKPISDRSHFKNSKRDVQTNHPLEVEFTLPTLLRIGSLSDPYAFLKLSLFQLGERFEDSLFFSLTQKHFKVIGEIFNGKPFDSHQQLLEAFESDLNFKAKFFKSWRHVTFGNRAEEIYDSGRHAYLAILDDFEIMRMTLEDWVFFLSHSEDASKDLMERFQKAIIYQLEEFDNFDTPFEVTIHHKGIIKKGIQSLEKTFWPISYNPYDILDKCFSTFQGKKEEHTKNYFGKYSVRLIVNTRENYMYTCYPFRTFPK